MKKITIVSGTNRKGSNTLKIAKQVRGMYQKLGAEVELLDLCQLPAEIFTPEAYETKPAAFGVFSDTVLRCDGLVLITPEYNGGAPGVLKYFIDMLKFPESFDSRPVCFVGLAAGNWGALRPVEQLQQIFGYRNAYIFPKRVFIPGVIEVLDDKGAVSDQDLKTRLERQSEDFLGFVGSVGS